MRLSLLIAALLLLAAFATARAATPGHDPAPAFDTQKRVPWTTSRVFGTPDPPLPYRLARVFEKLPLKEPLFLTHVPRTDNLLVIERSGRILVFPNRPDVAEAALFLDVGEETYSVA